MTRQPSGTIFALCFVAALCADSAPVWVTLAMVGIAGLMFLVWGVVGGKRHKKPPLVYRAPRAAEQSRQSTKQSIYRHYRRFRRSFQL